MKNGIFRGQLYKQLRGAAFSSNFREQLSRFEELQLWGNSFGQQLLVATLRRSFREPLCRMALGSRFGEQVDRIAALGQQLWRTALGHNFVEQRRGTALGSSFVEQLWTAFQTSWQLRAAALEFLGASLGRFGSNFEEQLWGATVGSNFAALQQH